MILLDRALALGGRGEARVQSEAGSVAPKLLEADRGAKLHVFDVILAIVMVANPLRFHDLMEGNAVLVVAAIGAVHGEAPNAAPPPVEAAGGGGKALSVPTNGPGAWDRSRPPPRARAGFRFPPRVIRPARSSTLRCLE